MLITSLRIEIQWPTAAAEFACVIQHPTAADLAGQESKASRQTMREGSIATNLSSSDAQGSQPCRLASTLSPQRTQLYAAAQRVGWQVTSSLARLT